VRSRVCAREAGHDEGLEKTMGGKVMRCGPRKGGSSSVSAGERGEDFS
jgi:hypothetical protein